MRRRTHGGFGFSAEPRISRLHANLGAAGIGLAILLVAGVAALPPAPQNQAAAPAATTDADRLAFAGAPEPDAGAVPQEETIATAASEPPQAPAPSPAPWEEAAAPAGAMQSELALAPIRTASSEHAFVPISAPDPAETSAIGTLTTETADPGDEVAVAVAESEAEIAALEAEQQAQNEGALAALREENGTAFNSPVMSSARVRQWVNMRSGPSNDAEVLAVVPPDAQIQAATDCNWCEVIYEGRRGFVYKRFLSPEG